MIPAGRTAADTVKAASLLGISPRTFTNTRRWEKLAAKPISRPDAKIRYWDEEQLIAAVEEREIPLLTPADPDAVYTVPVEDKALQELALDYLTAHLTGAGTQVAVADGAKIPAVGDDEKYQTVELVDLYAEDEPVAAEDQVIDLNAKLIATDAKGAWPLDVQLRLEFTGGRWVVCALTRENDDDLLDVEEAYLVIPEERRPTLSSWRTYTADKTDSKYTSGPQPDAIIFKIKHYRRGTIKAWDSQERFLQGEKKTGGRPVGARDSGPRRREAERSVVAEQRREQVRAMLRENPALTPAQVGEELGVSREWGRKLLNEVKDSKDA